MKYVVAAFLSAIFGVGACRAESPTPEKTAAAFFDTFIKGDASKAIDNFFALNPIFKDKVQQIQLLKSQLGTVTQLYGAPFAVELVSMEDLTPSVERRVYITKHKWVAVTWEMYFYRPKDIWVPNQLLFVDQFQNIGRKK